MKRICTLLTLLTLIVSYSTTHATPIYMRYEGVEGSVTAEVDNGKAAIKNLKPGKYKVVLVFTADQMRGPNGTQRSNAHVKVFNGRTDFAGGVSVAAGDVTGDGRATGYVGTSNGGVWKTTNGGATIPVDVKSGKLRSSATVGGKVTLQDIYLTLKPDRSGKEVTGTIAEYTIGKPGVKLPEDAFFDVFTELSFD